MAHERYVRSKWLKTEAILRDARVGAHIPKTGKLNESNLISYLDEFHMVYIKPDTGMHGRGIIRAEKVHTDGRIEYRFQSANAARTFLSAPSLCAAVLRRVSTRDYLVQQGIDLLTYEFRQFDIRVVVQTSPSGQWESTGAIGRLAAPQSIVTNYHRGGVLMPVDLLLSPYLDANRITEYMRSLYQLGQHTADAMQQQYPGVDTIGLDVGIDRRMQPWILEVNTRPGLYIFKKLQDRSIYGKMREYAKFLGRP